MMKWNYFFRNETFPKQLSREELHDLFVKMKHGDSKAREKIIKHNLRLIVSEVRKFEGGPYELEDLEAVGAIGLIKSVDTFDINKNFSFSTYAARCIQNEILIFMRAEQKQKYQEYLDCPIRKQDDEEGSSFKDMLVDENADLIANYEDQEIHMFIRSILNTLPKRDQEVMDLYFKEQYTQQEIGNLFGFTRSNTYEIIKKNLKKIKLALQKQGYVETSSELSPEKGKIGKKR